MRAPIPIYRFVDNRQRFGRTGEFEIGGFRNELKLALNNFGNSGKGLSIRIQHYLEILLSHANRRERFEEARGRQRARFARTNLIAMEIWLWGKRKSLLRLMTPGGVCCARR